MHIKSDNSSEISHNNSEAQEHKLSGIEQFVIGLLEFCTFLYMCAPIESKYLRLILITIRLNFRRV